MQHHLTVVRISMICVALIFAAATYAQPMVSARAHVVLEIVGGMNGGCGVARLDFIRILPDANIETGPGGLGWRVPVGQALVVTDVDWQYINPQGGASAGTIEVMRLSIQNLGNAAVSRRVFESTITLSSQGQGGMSESMTTGFVVSSKGRICPDVFPGPLGPPSGLQHLMLRGYLIADN